MKVLSPLTSARSSTGPVAIRLPAGAAEPGHDSLDTRLRRTLLAVVALGAAAPLTVGALLFLPESRQLVTEQQLWFFLHLAFGIMIVHAFAGGIVTLATRRASRLKEAVRLCSTVLLALASWFTVISGTWFVYPGYRAHPAEGAAADGYPQHYLEVNDKYFWHEFGMEWKEHVGWLTPILATAVAFIAYRYADVITTNGRARVLATALFAIAFFAAVVAAGLGAVINVVAPNDFLNR